MKIIIDCTDITPNPTGVGQYIINLLNRIHHPDNLGDYSVELIYHPGFRNWLFQNTTTLPSSLDGYKACILPFPRRISNRFVDFLPSSLASYCVPKSLQPDILHSPSFINVPFFDCVNIVTVHDVGFVKFPQYTDSIARYFGSLLQKSLKWIDVVITVSESAKRDFLYYFDFDPKNVFVTPLASRYSAQLIGDDNFHMDSTFFTRTYILFVGTIELRKNVKGLIEAFDLLKSHYKIPHKLLLIGKLGWGADSILKVINESQWSEDIHHLGFVSDAELPAYYKNASVFVYPSFYEGFGLPVLEALAFGTPVVCSNTSSLPEVVGDSALLVPPGGKDELADAIFKVVSDQQLRTRLVLKGKKQASQFSWSKTTRLTFDIYRSLT